MARILITGGSGFIGTNLVEYYKRLGYHITNLDVAHPRNPEHFSFWKRVDILDKEALAHAVVGADPEIVVHLAARTDLAGKTIGDYSANTDGVANLISSLEALEGLQVAVFASSMLVCRIGYKPIDELDYAPSTPYGESKIVGENLVRRIAANNFRWVIVRPTSIWGPWFQTPYRDFFTAIQRGYYVHARGIRVKRSYGFVLNTVYQLAQLASPNGELLAGKTIYLADHEPLEIGSWANMIQSTLGARRIREVPLSVLKLAARCGDMLKLCGYKNPPITSFRLNNMLSEMIHDTTPLQKIYGKLPCTTEEGVAITCNWLRLH